MIVSDHGFVIATPTKCGTTTIEEMARRHGGGRVSRGGVEVPSFRIATDERPRRQHRMVPPLGWENADRYMMVRNPFTRYMSQYEYLRAPHNYSKFGAKEIQGRTWLGWQRGRVGTNNEPMSFQQFLFFIARCRRTYSEDRWVKRRGPLNAAFAWRSPWIWLEPLDAQWDALRDADGEPDDMGVLRLENFWEEMAFLKDMYGLDTLNVSPTIRANKTLTYAGRTPQDYWGFGCVKRVWVGKEYRPDRADLPCKRCAACKVGVMREAVAMGYGRAEGVLGLGV